MRTRGSIPPTSPTQNRRIWGLGGWVRGGREGAKLCSAQEEKERREGPHGALHSRCRARRFGAVALPQQCMWRDSV